MSAPLHLKLVRDHSELATHFDAWQDLLAELPLASPMSGYPWVSAYFERRLEAGEDWFCVLAHRGEELVGVLPVISSPVQQLGTRFRFLRMPRDEHTSAVEPLLRPGYEREVWPRLLRRAEVEVPTALYVEMGRLPDTSMALAVVRVGMSRRPCRLEPAGLGAFLPVRGSFSEFRKRLSGNFRSNLNKAGRKLARLNDVRFEILTGEQATPDHLDRFTEVEARSWKGAAGTAIQCSPELVEFYRELVDRLWRARLLEWHFLEADGRTIAGNLAVRHGSRLVIWKLGYDEGYRRCSPGGLLLERVLEGAFEGGELREVDLLTDHDWYDNWRMKRRDYYHARIYSWRPLSMTCGYLPDRARAALREVPAVRKLVAFARERL